MSSAKHSKHRGCRQQIIFRFAWAKRRYLAPWQFLWISQRIISGGLIMAQKPPPQSDRQNIKHDLPAIFFEVLESRFPNELLLLSRFINLSSNFGVSRRPSLPAGSHVEESRRWWIHPVISGHSWYFVPFVPFLWHLKKPNVLLYLLLVKLKYPCCWWNPMINLTY